MFLSHYKLVVPTFYFLNLVIKIFATLETYFTFYKKQYTTMQFSGAAFKILSVGLY